MPDRYFEVFQIVKKDNQGKEILECAAHEVDSKGKPRGTEIYNAPSPQELAKELIGTFPGDKIVPVFTGDLVDFRESQVKVTDDDRVHSLHEEFLLGLDTSV